MPDVSPLYASLFGGGGDVCVPFVSVSMCVAVGVGCQGSVSSCGSIRITSVCMESVVFGTAESVCLCGVCGQLLAQTCVFRVLLFP